MANEAGSGCNDLSAGIGGYTFISNVPASLSGNCDRLAFYGTADEGAANFAFFTRDGNDFTTVPGTRQTLTVTGSGGRCIEFNAPGDFTAFAVSEGNYLGAYVVDPNQDYTNAGGPDIWGDGGDYTDIDSQTMTLHADHEDALTADITAAGGAAPTGTFFGPLYGPFRGVL